MIPNQLSLKLHYMRFCFSRTNVEYANSTQALAVIGKRGTTRIHKQDTHGTPDDWAMFMTVYNDVRSIESFLSQGVPCSPWSGWVLAGLVVD